MPPPIAFQGCTLGIVLSILVVGFLPLANSGSSLANYFGLSAHGILHWGKGSGRISRAGGKRFVVV